MLPASVRSAQDWRVLVAVFWAVAMVEGLGVAQIFAFVPIYLREMGVSEAEALGTLRLTLGRDTTANDVSRAADALTGSWRRALLRHSLMRS